MTRTLVIIPTKNRLEDLNCLIQNLIYQEGNFDVYIADMSTDPKYLLDSWRFRTGLDRLKNLGHNYFVFRVDGNNQLYGYQAGLTYALQNGYDLCLGGDDDLIYDPGFIRDGIKLMEERPDCGILVGLTLLPWQSVKYVWPDGQVMPDYAIGHVEMSGTFAALSNGGYAHCTMINPHDDSIKEYQQVYGGFFFRTKEAVEVGGFPTYLSPLGYRGEMILQTAIYFSGKKLLVNPKMISWHYSTPHGGLRLVQGDLKKKSLEEDNEIWKKMLKRGKPTTVRPI